MDAMRHLWSLAMTEVSVLDERMQVLEAEFDILKKEGVQQKQLRKIMPYKDV